jgi:hypothetical protein
VQQFLDAGRAQGRIDGLVANPARHALADDQKGDEGDGRGHE